MLPGCWRRTRANPRAAFLPPVGATPGRHLDPALALLHRSAVAAMTWGRAASLTTPPGCRHARAGRSSPLRAALPVDPGATARGRPRRLRVPKHPSPRSVVPKRHRPRGPRTAGSRPRPSSCQAGGTPKGAADLPAAAGSAFPPLPRRAPGGDRSRHRVPGPASAAGISRRPPLPYRIPAEAGIPRGASAHGSCHGRPRDGTVCVGFVDDGAETRFHIHLASFTRATSRSWRRAFRPGSLRPFRAPDRSPCTYRTKTCGTLRDRLIFRAFLSSKVRCTQTGV